MAANKVKRLLIAILVTVLVLSPLIYLETHRESIHQAEIHEIQAIDGFGDELSLKVINYIEDNPEACMDDLLYIKGIGKKRLELLKEVFK